MAGTPTVLIARTDAHSANLLTSDVDDADKVRGLAGHPQSARFSGGNRRLSCWLGRQVVPSHACNLPCVTRFLLLISCSPQPFCTGKRTPEGFYYVNCGVKVRLACLLALFVLEPRGMGDC